MSPWKLVFIVVRTRKWNLFSQLFKPFISWSSPFKLQYVTICHVRRGRFWLWTQHQNMIFHCGTTSGTSVRKTEKKKHISLVIKVQVAQLLDGFWKDHLERYKLHTVSRCITIFIWVVLVSCCYFASIWSIWKAHIAIGTRVFWQSCQHVLYWFTRQFKH